MSYVFAKRESDNYRFPCQVRCDGCHRVEPLRGNTQSPQYTEDLPVGFVRAHWIKGSYTSTVRHLCDHCIQNFGHFEIE
jgi:hypothetical protein